MTWPEWLTPDYTNLHTAVENAIKTGTYGVYQSADAAGMDWTADGMLSCQASAVLSQLKADGWTPPAVVPVVERLPDPEREWFGDEIEDDGEHCEHCGATLDTPCHPESAS